MSSFVIKRGDTLPPLIATLQDAKGVVANLSGATVKFLMRTRDGVTLKVNAGAIIVTPAAGLVRYEWEPEDTDVAGKYRGEFEVTFAVDEIETFPNGGYIPISVNEDLG